MIVPLSWLSEFLYLEDVSPELIAEELTLKSVEASLKRWDRDIDGVVFGRLVEKKPHPRLELSIYRVQVGEGLYLQVVSADKSLNVGDGLLLALPNARVGNMCITKREFDGVISEGMLLSAKELGLESHSEGVLVLHEDIKLGTSAYDLLGFGELLLEIEPTPNRGDLLSVKGLARELSAIMGLRRRERSYPKFEELGHLNIRIESFDCKRYRGAIIEDVQVKNSPLWLRLRLWQCGLRSINNLVDITNYIMLQEGQPLHAFDLDRIEPPIVVRDAREGERLLTLMGSERELIEKNLLIADSRGPIAVAGLIGGLESGVLESTKRVLLESAYFEPYRIRRSARSLSIQTDSSYRFERGVDIEGVRLAQDLAIELIMELAGGRLTALRDSYPQPYLPKKVFLSLEKFRRYSGEDFDRESVSKTLSALDIPHKMLRCGVEAYIPSHRSFDMSEDVDLIEEIMRVKGLDSFKSEVLPVPSRAEAQESLEEQIRGLLIGRGLSEVITFSFEDEELYGILGLERPTLEILNPLTKSQRFLRSSLVPSLLRVCVENQRRHNYSMGVFELGKVYSPTGEEKRLGFLLTGEKSLYPEELYSPYDGLSIVLDILRLYCEEWEEEKSKLGFLHPHIQRAFRSGGESIAFVGLLHPSIQSRLQLRGRVILGEVKLHTLKRVKKTYTPISNYPPVIRDLTLVVDKSLWVDKLISHIKGKEMVEEVRVFSLFTDPKLGEGKKSVSLRISFRSKEATLSDQVVNQTMEELIAELEDRFYAKLR
ncbi:MAG: phenylalanine--tRNA ligase subunit beta [Acidobacteria bacterium]|nr:MAG: phenylalanine--tRNA ligase subunit beta [Acidobacteriota bacterium]